MSRIDNERAMDLHEIACACLDKMKLDDVKFFKKTVEGYIEALEFMKNHKSHPDILSVEHAEGGGYLVIKKGARR